MRVPSATSMSSFSSRISHPLLLRPTDAHDPRGNKAKAAPQGREAKSCCLRPALLNFAKPQVQSHSVLLTPQGPRLLLIQPKMAIKIQCQTYEHNSDPEYQQTPRQAPVDRGGFWK